MSPWSSDPAAPAAAGTGRRRPALETRRVSVAYSGTTVLRDVTLTMRANAVSAVVGPSGCGKSSFLIALNRLDETIPGCRVTGEVALFGRPLESAYSSREALRRRVAMIFQQPTPFPVSIRRNLEIPIREHYGGARPETEGRMESALKAVGLWQEVADRLEASAASLSGGQQQRLCLARALALEPEVLLLDEPCSALDPMATERVEELLAELKKDLSLVLVTHNLAQARRLADDITLFWIGQDCGYAAESGPAEEILTRPKTEVARAYFSGRMG